MKNSLKIVLIAFTFLNFESKSQVIISQDFEGSLTGWINQGLVTSSQNSISPYAGTGMVALSTGNALTSPTFSLPGGVKHISFWFNSFNDAPFNYSMSVDLLQNNTVVLALGTWQGDIYSNLNPWAKNGINIPAGFSGNDYSLRFNVPSFINPNAKFYVDEIYVSIGAYDVGVKEKEYLNHNFKVFQDPLNTKRIKVYSNTISENTEIEVNSIDGRVVFYRSEINIQKSSSYEIDLSGVSEGLFVIKLRNKNSEFIRKIIL